MLRCTALISLAAAGILLAGCGSSKSAKDEYAERVDAVCAHFAPRLKADAAAVSKALDSKDAKRTIAALNRRARDLALRYNRMNDFRPPVEGRIQAQRLLHAAESQALITDEWAVAVAAPGPSDTAFLVRAIRTNEAEAHRAATAYGMLACAKK